MAKIKDLESVRMDQIDKLKESNSKLSGSGVISGVQMTAITESRQRFMEEFNRINDESKRKLASAMKDNN